MSVPSHFGRYRVLRPLASGEMGVVYLAEDPLIGRNVAIKGIRFDPHVDDEEIRRLQARFDQEIQIAGTFSHPNIVTLFDVGRQNGRSFIAMEYVEGRNLRAQLQATGPMSPEEAVDLGAQVCRALEYAHQRKIIHRDIKPTNILVSAEGVPKITDFGVARLFGSTLTHAGKIFGTPAYMSPEQAVGGNLTGASDQFAIAAVLYELLTGERPFKGTSPTAVIYEVIEHDPVPAHEIAPLVPIRISEAVMRGLAKSPEGRFESCGAFADALEEAVAWSRANPDKAYLDETPERPMPAPAAPSPVEEKDDKTFETGPWIPVDDLQVRVRELIGAYLRSDQWERIRQPWIRLGGDSRSVAAFAAGTLGLVALFMLVTWAASASGPTTGAEGAASDTGSMLAAGAGASVRQPVAEPPRRDPKPAPVASSRPSVEDGAGKEGPAAAMEPRSFVIATRPAGASVSLDGELLAEVTPVAIELAPGDVHIVQLELEGHHRMAWRFSWDTLSEAHFESGQLYFPLERLTPDYSEEELAGSTATWAVDLSSALATEEEEEPEAEARPTVTEGPPPAPTEVRRVRAPTDAPLPEKVRHVEPELPAGTPAEGSIVLEIEVSARGNVIQAKVLRGLSAAINQAALNAVVRWKYEPTVVGGVPVHVVMNVTLPIGEGGR